MKNSNIKILYILFSIFFLIDFQNSFAETSMYSLEGGKLFYKNDNKLIVAERNASARSQDGKEIFADKIIYNKDKNIITTEPKSIFKDNKGNTLFADKFIYDVKLKKIEATSNVKFLDKNGNLFQFTKLIYFDDAERGVGENLVATLKDKSSIESERAEFDNNLKTLIFGENKKLNFFEILSNLFKNKKNTYTSCENKEKTTKTIEERCPAWSITSQTNIHDQNEKMIYHYDTLIKIKNIPVFYTPYFAHPDPSVKRKSGFLTPVVKNISDLGQTIKMPYFFEIDKKRDLTFSPIYYFNENSVFLGEYRQQNVNSKFYIDTSYTQGYRNKNKVSTDGTLIQRDIGTRNHFFFNFLGSYDDLLFNKNDIEINIQRVSQKNYLNVHQINTEHVRQEMNALNNNIILNSYQDNKKINIRTNIYENLNIDNSNTKYQYTVPSIDFSNFFKKNDYNIALSNSFSATNFGGDSNQVYLNNKIDASTDPKQFKFLENFSNIFKASINNVNFNNQNINYQKENLNSDIYITGAIETSYPLIAINNFNEKILTPKIFTKFTSGSMTNSNNENKILSYDDIYSMNRMNNAITPETGASIGYGVEYNDIRKNSNNEIIQKIDFTIGQVIKPEKIDQMPNSSTLKDTRSAFVGTAYYKKNIKNINNIKNHDIFDTKYDYIISNNLNKILKSSIISNITLSKNTFTGSYYETHDISNEHYAEMKFSRKFDNDLNFAFGGRVNIQDNFTENNFIETSWENDCIKLGLNLSKTFYKNEEIRPSKSLSMIFVLKPFGNLSPNLSSFLN